jgi:Protein of unknown function (DUF3152)
VGLRTTSAAWVRLGSLLGVFTMGLALGLAPAQAADPITNTVLPVVSGQPTYGQTLTASPGTWTPAAGLTFGYQWLRDGVELPSASAASYTLGLTDMGHAMAVRVDATDGVSTVSATSEVTTLVAKARFANTKLPQVSGRPRIGRVVTTTAGSWSPTATKITYQWRRNGASIRGATEAAYRLKVADFGARVDVVATATREGFQRASAPSTALKVKHRVGVRRVATYRVETRGKITTSLAQFKRLAQETYDDPRGWRAQGVQFKRVAKGGSFTLVLAQASWVPRFSSACSSTWSCRVGRHVIINQTRWKSASPAWNDYGRSLRDYRNMVVNHETGHWLGRGHLGCPRAGAKAPVMMQQSKGLAGCRANPWPTRSELHLGHGRLVVINSAIAE